MSQAGRRRVMHMQQRRDEMNGEEDFLKKHGKMRKGLLELLTWVQNAEGLLDDETFDNFQASLEHKIAVMIERDNTYGK